MSKFGFYLPLLGTTGFTAESEQIWFLSSTAGNNWIYSRILANLVSIFHCWEQLDLQQNLSKFGFYLPLLGTTGFTAKSEQISEPEAP
jgi:hypothetical protein